MRRYHSLCAIKKVFIQLFSKVGAVQGCVALAIAFLLLAFLGAYTVKEKRLIGDPYEEFYKLECFGIEVSVPYSIGQIDEYFDDEIPNDFWGALAVYCAHAALFSIKWAEQFGQSDVDGMVERCKRAFENYDNFNSIIPKWYDGDLKNKLN